MISQNWVIVELEAGASEGGIDLIPYFHGSLSSSSLEVAEEGEADLEEDSEGQGEVGVSADVDVTLTEDGLANKAG